MDTYTVTVRRIVREDTQIKVEADTPEAARQQALLQAPDADGWDGYDCEYWLDDGDIIKGDSA